MQPNVKRDVDTESVIVTPAIKERLLGVSTTCIDPSRRFLYHVVIVVKETGYHPRRRLAGCRGSLPDEPA